jgi:aspartyl-tRNA synthetase
MQDYIFSHILEVSQYSEIIVDLTLYIFIQLNEKEKAPFDRLLHALRCGAPPHGGIALGIDAFSLSFHKTHRTCHRLRPNDGHLV